MSNEFRCPAYQPGHRTVCCLGAHSSLKCSVAPTLTPVVLHPSFSRVRLPVDIAEVFLTTCIVHYHISILLRTL
jgi:hypothetical protein